MKAEDNFLDICKLTTDTLNIPYDNIFSNSRMKDIVIPRAVASMVAILGENTKHSVIAKVFNKNRASIYYYEKQHSNNFAYWAEYRRAFNKVLGAYQAIESSKKTFKNTKQMNEFFTNNEINGNASGDIFVIVKSGKNEIKIKTSYFDFSDLIKKIKFVLKDYKYDFKII